MVDGKDSGFLPFSSTIHAAALRRKIDPAAIIVLPGSPFPPPARNGCNRLAAFRRPPTSHRRGRGCRSGTRGAADPRWRGHFLGPPVPLGDPERTLSFRQLCQTSELPSGDSPAERRSKSKVRAGAFPSLASGRFSRVHQGFRRVKARAASDERPSGASACHSAMCGFGRARGKDGAARPPEAVSKRLAASLSAGGGLRSREGFGGGAPRAFYTTARAAGRNRGNGRCHCLAPMFPGEEAWSLAPFFIGVFAIAGAIALSIRELAIALDPVKAERNTLPIPEPPRPPEVLIRCDAARKGSSDDNPNPPPRSIGRSVQPEM